MVYQAVTEVISLFRRNDFPQCHFNFLRILDSIHKANPVGETNAVCISDNSWFTEYIAHDQIGTFASYAREGEKSVKVTWNIVMVFFMQDFHCLLYTSPSPRDTR